MGARSSKESGSTAVELNPTQLTPEQQALAEVLRNLAPWLEQTYIAGLSAELSPLPGAIPLAAHSMRELLYRLPEIVVDRSLHAVQQALTERVKGAAGEWRTKRQRSTAYQESRWQPDGTIDRVTVEMLTLADDLFESVATGYPRRSDQVSAAMRSLDASRQLGPPTVQESFRRRWVALKEYFDSVAHHGFFPERLDYISKARELETLLLTRLRPRTVRDREAIAQLISNGAATDPQDVLEELIPLIEGNPSNYAYFFQSLDAAIWIQPLAQRYFRLPPPVESDGEYSWAPVWPESRFLVRVATQAPDEVVRIAVRWQNLTNPRVLEDVVQIGLRVPAGLATQLVPTLTSAAPEVVALTSLGAKLGQFIQRLARSGKHKQANRLLPGALKPYVARAAEPYPFGDLQALLQSAIPELFRTDKPKVPLNNLVRALDYVLQRDAPEPDPIEGLSCVWRPSIADHASNLGGTVRDALVDSLRDGLLNACRYAPANTKLIAEALLKKQRALYRRLAVYILSEFCEAAPELVAATLTSRANLSSPDLWPEYYRLASRCFPTLRSTEQTAILDAIAEGPMSDDWDAAAPWRRQRLHPLRPHLTADQAARFPELHDSEAEHIDEHAELTIYHEVQHGHRSPMSTDELAEMPVDDLVRYLQQWTPKRDSPLEPSRAGLAGQLKEAVLKRPAFFALEALRFEELRAVYHRDLFYGLTEAFRSGETFDCRKPLELAAAILQEATAERSEDPDRKGRSLAIAQFCVAALEPGECELDFGERELVASIIVSLSQDPDPTRDLEERRGDHLDPTHIAINSVRGAALSTILSYALWVRRHLSHDAPPGFAAMAEVAAALNRHLNTEVEPSLAVRSVYGRWFPTLLYLDPEWSRANVSVIFPVEPRLEGYRYAAWSSYVMYSHGRLTADAFRLLTPAYATAVDRIGSSSSRGFQLADVDECLSQHLMMAYRAGLCSLDDEHDLVRRLFRETEPPLRKHAIASVGQGLLRSTEPLPKPTEARLRRLWEWRLEEAESGTESHAEAELPEFGWWFASGAFGDDWSLSALNRCLDRAKRTNPEHLVAKRLSDLVSDYPAPVMSVLASMVDGDQEGWAVTGWLEPARIILETCISSQDLATRAHAARVRDTLVARGHDDFASIRSE